MSRIAAYARVSTRDQECLNQLSEIRQYAAARGWEIQEDYVDTGWSGAKASRPALDRLMKDALARKVDCILCVRLDRWGRSVRHLSDSLAKLKSAGVRWMAISQGIDTDANNPMTDLLINMLSAIAQFERELIRERVAAGIARAKKTGTKSGKPPGRPTIILNRQAVRDARDAGLTITALQVKFGLSRGMVSRILAK